MGSPGRLFGRSCSSAQEQCTLIQCIAALVLLYCGAGMADGSPYTPYKAFFVIGDSYVDNGNRDPNNFTQTPIGPVNQDWRYPYGVTRPGTPAGRFSNGNLLSDFLAASIGLSPAPAPYRTYLANHLTSVANGINFAVGGAGVFPNLGFTKTGDQITQLKAVINAGVYNSSVYDYSFILYSISGNDYAAFDRSTANLNPVQQLLEVTNFIIEVVAQITQDLQALYEMGFKNFVVQKLEPLGCLPTVTYLNDYTSCNQTDNVVTTLHNIFLSQLNALPLGPDANLIFLDIAEAFNAVLVANTTQTGFPTPLKPCCIANDPATQVCGDVNATTGAKQFTVCNIQSTQPFFWDNNHPTEAGWAYLFNLFLNPPFPLSYTTSPTNLTLRSFLGLSS